MVQIVTAKVTGTHQLHCNPLTSPLQRKTGSTIAFDHGDALQIAVHTHTETTAIQLDPLDANEKMRTTRTPARPDLAERLARMRKEKKEREERETYGMSSPPSWNEKDDDDLDIKDEFDWKNGVRTYRSIAAAQR